MIEKTMVFVEKPLKIRGVTIVTVSEVKGEYHHNDNSLGGYCNKQPLALALITSEGVKAFTIDGNEMKIDDFVQEFPVTRNLLEKRLRRRENRRGNGRAGP